MQFIFVHGGPGLNSFPEKNIFGQKHTNIHFWNEPSILRDSNFNSENAYQNWLKSLALLVNELALKSPVTVIAHSFAAFAINDLLPTLHDKIAKLILVAPILNLKHLDTNIVDLAITLYARSGNINAVKELSLLKSQMPDAFNEQRFNTLLKALGQEELLSTYWFQKEAATLYASFCTDKKYQFDLQSFKSVRSTIPYDENKNIFNKETTLIYGSYDPVAKIEQDYLLAERLYPNAKFRVSKSSGHWVHFEDKAILEDELTS